MDNITKMFNIKQFIPITKTSLCGNDSHHVPLLDQDNERTIPSYVRQNSTGEAEEEQDLFGNQKSLYKIHFGHQNTEMSHNQQSLLGDHPATFRGGSGSPSKKFIFNGIQQGGKVSNLNGKRWHDHNIAGSVSRQPIQSFQFRPRFDGNRNAQFGCFNNMPYQCYQNPRSNTPQMPFNFFEAPNGQFEPHWQVFNCHTPGPAMAWTSPCEGGQRRWNRGKRCQKHPTNRTEFNKSAHNNSKSSPNTMTPRCTKGEQHCLVSPCKSVKPSKCDSDEKAFQQANKETIPQAQSLKVCDAPFEKMENRMADLSIGPSGSEFCKVSDSARTEGTERTPLSHSSTVCEGNEHRKETVSKLQVPSSQLPSDSSSPKLCNCDIFFNKVPEMSPRMGCNNITVTVKKSRNTHDTSHSDAIHMFGKICDKNDKAAKDCDKNSDLTCDKVPSCEEEYYSDVHQEQLCFKPADKNMSTMEFQGSVETQREKGVLVSELFTPGRKGKKGRPSSKKRRRMKLKRDPDNVTSSTANETQNTASTKKFKTRHGKDEIGANVSSSGIHVQIKCNDISMEEDNNNADTQSGPQSKTPPKKYGGVAFILGMQSSDDEDTNKTNDHKSDKRQTSSAPSPLMTKFSFIISHSDSDSDSDTDSDFGSEEEDEVDSSFSSDLWDSFAGQQDSNNPFKLQISCRLTPPAKGKPLPKSASDSDLASGSKLAQLNKKWNIRYSVQLESDPLRFNQEVDTPRSNSEKKKVHFPESDLEEMVLLPEWDIEQGMEERRGPWEQCARDRCRFASRIKEVEDKISFIFEPELRQRVYNRFDKA